MQITDFFLLIVGVLNLVLALFVGFSNRRDPVNVSFAFFAGSLFFWSWSLVLFRFIEDSGFSIWPLKASYLSVMLSASSFYVFVHYFPERMAFTPGGRWFLGLGTAFIAAFLLTPGVLITEVKTVSGIRFGVQELAGYSLFSAYFIIYFFGSLYFLFRRWQTAESEDRVRLGYILWSILTAGILGVFFNLVLPSPFLQEWRYIWSGPIFTAIIVTAVIYAMARHALFDTRIVATVAFVAALSMALLFNVFIPAPLPYQIIKVILFAAVILVGYLLIQSILREIESKRHIEALAAKLSAANDELKKLDEAKSEFISIAGHQLRTPLTVIKGYTSMMLEGSFGKIEAKGREALDKVLISSTILAKLVSDLLDLSRIEAGRIRYEFKPVALGDIVHGVLQELEETAKAKGVSISFEDLNAAKLPVMADFDKMHEVVMNLIDNAVKYSAGKPVAVKLEPVIQNGKRNLRFSVRDQGMGIKPEDLSRLFTKFTRSDEAKKVRPDGMGLGLYLVKKLVEDHRGRAWAESEGIGKGSSFFVELPVD